MQDHPLISWLAATAAEGLAAGVVSGLVLLILQSDVRLLIEEQADPATSFGIFLIVCSQIGVLIAVCFALLTDRSS